MMWLPSYIVGQKAIIIPTLLAYAQSNTATHNPQPLVAMGLGADRAVWSNL